MKISPVHSVILGNHFKVGFRQMRRSKFFTFINIVGLSVSMTIALLALGFILEVKSYDNFHSQNIYRVITDLKEGDSEVRKYATASLAAGELLQEEYPGFDRIAYIYKGFRGDMKWEDKIINVQGLYASEQFFELFSFDLLYGDPGTALNTPESLVLTEATAMKLFGMKDVVGEVIRWRDQKEYIITAIARNVPHNSHIQFEAIASIASMNNNHGYVYNWQNMWNSYVYIQLENGQEKYRLLSALNEIGARENERLPYFDASFKAQRLEDILPGEKRYNQLGVRMNSNTINWVGILTIIIMISACFNYSNLSIARSFQRAREVGVRKVIGSSREQLIGQFIIEALLLSLVSLVFALGLFALLKAEFISLNEDFQRTIKLEWTPELLIYFISFSVLTGLIAGVIPAIVHSKINAITGLKSLKTGRGKSWSAGARKVLIGFQLTISLLFMTLVLLTHKQYQHAINFDLGFNTENIYNIQLQGNDPDLVRAELERIPEITGISQSNYFTSTGALFGEKAKYIPTQDSTLVYHLSVDEHFISNLGHQLIAGKDFTGSTIDGSSLIVNESLVDHFGFGLDNAIGKVLTFNGRPCQIIGIVKDFHYGTLETEIEPFAFTSLNDHRHLNLKIRSNDMIATFHKIDEAWRSVDKVHPMRGEFYDERIERAYSSLSTIMKTIGFLTLAAVSISLLGLLGMVVFSIAIRTKELTIRKVLGASLIHLYSQLSKGFVLMFCLAILITVPLSYYLFSSIITDKLVYKVNVGVTDMSLGIIIMLGLIIISTGTQVLRAARMNPAKNLRNE